MAKLASRKSWLFVGSLMAATGLAVGIVTTLTTGGAAPSPAFGTLNLTSGAALNVTCPNSLSNSSVVGRSETVNCGVPVTTTTTQPVTTTTQPVTTTTQPVTTTVPASTTLPGSTTTQPVTTTSQPPTTTVPATTSTTTVGTVNCTSTSPTSLCGPYDYPANTANDGSNVFVGSDGWNNQAGETYNLQVAGPNDWSDTVTAKPCNCVSAYPSVEQYAPDGTAKAMTSFNTIVGTYAESMGANSASSTHAAWDIWANGFSTETLVMNDKTALDPGCDSTILASPSFTDPTTGATDTYQFCKSGSEREFILQGNKTAGGTDILAMFKWMTANGYMPAGATMSEIDYGWEILSTGSVPQTFSLSGWTVTYS